MRPGGLFSWWRPQRSQQQEWLDAAEIPARELQQNLRDLQRLNTCLGSRWLLLRAQHRLWRRAGRPRSWRVLDVGTGAGDIPLALRHWGQRQGIALTLVGLDNHRGVMQVARTALHGHPSITLMQADGLRLPFRDQAFDAVVCSTMVHHLQWQEVVRLLRAMAAVARHGVVVNDLVRGWVPYYGAHGLLWLLARSRLTRHDGPLSVLRAYSIAEVRQMASEAGLPGVQVRAAFGYRWLLVYTPPAPCTEA